MAVGGNNKARQFFKQHGWDETGSDKIESKVRALQSGHFNREWGTQAFVLLSGSFPCFCFDDLHEFALCRVHTNTSWA